MSRKWGKSLGTLSCRGLASVAWIYSYAWQHVRRKTKNTMSIYRRFHFHCSQDVLYASTGPMFCLTVSSKLVHPCP